MKKSSFLLVMFFSIAMAAAENAVKNPGFEGNAKDWIDAGGCGGVIAGAGADGSSAYCYTRTDSEKYTVLSQPVSLAPGRKYRVGAKLKNNTDKTFPVSMAVEYSRDGAYVGGKYMGGSLTGENQDWVEVSGEFTAGDEGMRYALSIYLEHGVTGSFFIDDVYIIEEESEWHFGQVWPWGNTAQPGDEIVFKSWYPDIPAADQVIVFQLFSGDEPLGEVSAAPDENGNIRMPVGDMAPGKYTIRAALTDVCDVRRETELPLTVVEKRARKVEVNPDGSLLVNGEYFYPVGIYSSDSYKDDQAEAIAKLGFNCQLSYCINGDPRYDIDQVAAHLDKCWELGVRVIFCLKFNLDASGDPETFQNGVSPWIKRFKDHPALLAWYLMDEPQEPQAPLAEAGRRFINELDPDHPVWAVFANQLSLGTFINGTDFIGVDIYPFHGPEGNLNGMVKGVQDIRRHELPVWLVAQSYPMSNYMNVPRYIPSAMQLLSQGVAGFIADAGGLLYYSYFDLAGLNKPNPTAEKDLENMARAVKLLKDVSKFRACDLPEWMIPEEESNVVWRLLADGPEYRLLVLAPETAGTFRMELPAGVRFLESATGKTEFADGVLTFRGEGTDSDIISLREKVCPGY